LGTRPTPTSREKNYKCPLNSNLLVMYSALHNTVSAESAVRVDSIQLIVPKFKFVAIIVHACDLQSLAILLKNNVHNLYIQHYYNTKFIIYYRNTNFIEPWSFSLQSDTSGNRIVVGHQAVSGHSRISQSC
jgi:hypothetical protein